MLASVRSELAIMRTMAVSFGIMCVIVCIFMCFGMGSYAGASAACAMVPMLVMFSLLGYDERNDWLRYRCALPFSRHDIVIGRYATILICSAIAVVVMFVVTMVCMSVFPLFGVAIEKAPASEIFAACLASTFVVLGMVSLAQPFSIKFGSTQGARYISYALMLVGCLIFVASRFALPEAFSGLGDWVVLHPVLSLIVLIVISLAIYTMSCMISIRILQKKDL